MFVFLEVNEVIDSFYLTQIMATVYEKRLGKKYNKMSYFATVGFKNVPLLSSLLGSFISPCIKPYRSPIFKVLLAKNRKCKTYESNYSRR